MSLLTLKDYEEYASEKLEKGLSEYLSKGSQNDVTLNANVSAFKQFRIRPRYMIDVSERDLNTKLFDDTIRMPIAVSPSGLHKRFHPDGELETAKGIEFNDYFLIID
jgi:isopentenyl diphosphate isomerase/L-lactate dehydrogenase-like FMN-dependent dehydrogenase